MADYCYFPLVGKQTVSALPGRAAQLITHGFISPHRRTEDTGGPAQGGV